MSWRIVVDRDLCQGHEVCEAEAPELFEVPKHGTVTVLTDNVSEGQLAAARAAVKYCPTHALSIVEGD